MHTGILLRQMASEASEVVGGKRKVAPADEYHAVNSHHPLYVARREGAQYAPESRTAAERTQIPIPLLTAGAAYVQMGSFPCT